MHLRRFIPSAVSLRLFEPAGKAMVDSLNGAWREVFDRPLQSSTDLNILARLIDARYVVRVAMTFAGAVMGRLAIYARPEMLIDAILKLHHKISNEPLGPKRAAKLAGQKVELVPSSHIVRTVMASIWSHCLPAFGLSTQVLAHSVVPALDLTNDWWFPIFSSPSTLS